MIRFRLRPIGPAGSTALGTGLEAIASLALYCATVVLLETVVGKAARILALPMVAYWGFRRGAIGGVLAGITTLLPPLFGPVPDPPATRLFVLGFHCSLGAVVGRMGDLSRRLRHELVARRMAEGRLLEEQATFRIFFDGNPHPMWIFDTETLRFLAVNQAKANLYGYSIEEFMRMTVADIQMPENVPTLRTFLEG